MPSLSWATGTTFALSPFLFRGDRHNEVGGPLKETMTASRYVSPINFPGPGGTVTLLDVSEGRGRQVFHGGGRW